MKEGHEETESEKIIQADSPSFEKWETALTVLKEAVANAGIRNISEYKGEPLDLRWHVFYQDSDKDVVLKMLVKGLFGLINADVSLITTAKWIVDEVETVLTQPDATRIFDFNGEDLPEIVREHSRMILTGYVTQIPIVAFQVLSQAARDAVQSHIKTYVEPLLKEHWESLGLPRVHCFAKRSF